MSDKNIRQHWKSQFPACIFRRRNEAVATNTVFSDTPAVDSGIKAAQLFIGRNLLLPMHMVSKRKRSLSIP